MSRFRACERGVSAIEFAICAPVLVILMLGGFQLVAYADSTRKVASLTNSISEMITQASPPTPGGTTATVNFVDITFSLESALVVFPYLMKDANRQGVPWYLDITINYASIAFAKNGSPCAGTDFSTCYNANVVWTSAYLSPTARQCAVKQQPMADTAPPSPTGLPKSAFGPGSIIAIDVSFTFKPLFMENVLPPVTIKRSAYVKPRYVTLINYDYSQGGGIIQTC